MPSDPRVSVGCAALVVRGGQLLLLRRQGKHAAGLWSAPGGWLDFGETPKTAAVRELLEESGLESYPWNLKFVDYVNNIFSHEQIHSVTMHFLVFDALGEPKNLEPEKCSEMRWFPLDAVPSQNELFPGLGEIIERARIILSEET